MSMFPMIELRKHSRLSNRSIYYKIYNGLVKLSYSSYPLPRSKIFQYLGSVDKNREKFQIYFLETGFVEQISENDPYYYLRNSKRIKTDKRIRFGLYRITKRGQMYIERFRLLNELFIDNLK